MKRENDHLSKKLFLLVMVPVLTAVTLAIGYWVLSGQAFQVIKTPEALAIERTQRILADSTLNAKMDSVEVGGSRTEKNTEAILKILKKGR